MIARKVSLIIPLICLTAASCAHHPKKPTPATAPVALTPATAPVIAPLMIDVTDLRNRNGQILLCVFNQPAGFPADKDDAVVWQIRPAKPPLYGPIHMQVNLPVGDYAVAVVHDENANGKLDKGAFGVPSEGYGASNNPKPQMRAPRFQEAKFSLPPEGMRVVVSMRYF